VAVLAVKIFNRFQYVTDFAANFALFLDIMLKNQKIIPLYLTQPDRQIKQI
jgi:hypothetical protein